jgi:hypothetical protein
MNRHTGIKEQAMIFEHPFRMKLIKKFSVAGTLDPSMTMTVSMIGVDVQAIMVTTRMEHNDL